MEVAEPAQQVEEFGRTLRGFGRRLRRLLPYRGKLPLRRCEMIRETGPVLSNRFQSEFMLRVGDQLVDEAGKKFARSQVKFSTWSRSHAMAGSV